MNGDSGLQFVRLTDYSPTSVALGLLPEEVARRNVVVPLWLDEEDQLVVAAANPADQRGLRDVARTARRPVRPLLASYPEIRTALDRIYGGEPTSSPTPDLVRLLRYLGFLSDEELEGALLTQAETSEPLGQACLGQGLLSELDLAEALAWRHNLPHVRLDGVKPQVGFSALMPWELARERGVIPLWWLGGGLVIGAATLDDGDTYEAVAKRLDMPVRPVVCPQTQWSHTFQRLYLRGQIPDEPAGLSVVDILLRQGAISELDVRGARAVNRKTGQPLEEILLAQGLISRKQWLRARSQVMGVPLGSLEETIPAEVVRLLPGPVARACHLLPLDRADSRLIVGMQAVDQELITLVESLTGLEVEPRLLDPSELMTQLSRAYGDAEQPQFLETGPRLGELLVTTGLISEAQLTEALEAGRAAGKRLGERLVNLGYLDDEDLAEALSLQTGLPYARLDHARFDGELIRQIPSDLAQRYQVVPLLAADGDLWVAVADPLDGAGLRATEEALGVRVWPVITPRPVITATIDRFFGAELRRLDPRTSQFVEKLVSRGFLNQQQASTVLRRYVTGQIPLDRAIVEASSASEADVASTLAEELRVPLLDLQLHEETIQTIDALGQPVVRKVIRDPIDAPIARLISAEAAQRLTALPVARTDGQVIVVFADPMFGPAIQELEATLGLRVRPGLAQRSVLEEAIQRVLGQKNIGTYLLLAGAITRGELNDALELAQRTGVRLGRALVARGYATQQQLYQFLAEQANLPLFDLSAAEFEDEVVRLIDAETERAYGILPVAADDELATLAMVDPLNVEALEVASEKTSRTMRPVIVTEQDMEAALERIYRTEYLARSTSELLERAPEDSAFRVLSLGQKVFLGVLVFLSLLWLVVDYISFFIVFNTLSSIFYLGFSAYKFYLVYRAMAHDLEVPVTDEDVAALDDRDLPVYTILIPVYKEAEVLSDLLQAVNKMDYPTTKMDIKVLMEADDLDTIHAFHQLNLPPHFQRIIVPTAEPKTKPKACNYGLIHARGDYVVIYDAEDMPEPDQLKRVLVAYDKVPKEVVCIQAKLNYYNRRQNLLTRWFTVEYSMWFDLFLPGLDASDAPIPLGGTSNHFKRHALVEVGAWDPHNVTEDADLGIRLYKRGYKTATVDSTTFEEANSELYNWIRQRSRWHKGYIQTWLVHMRHPLRLIREIGLKPFLSFQLVVGGTFFAALMNPIYWALTALWFLTKWDLVQQVYPGVTFYMGAICLYLGNFAFTYMNVAGAMRRGYYDIVKYALLSPLYWGLMSLGAWKGFLQLIRKPHFWEKTVHGLYEGAPDVEKAKQLKDLV